LTYFLLLLVNEYLKPSTASLFLCKRFWKKGDPQQAIKQHQYVKIAIFDKFYNTSTTTIVAVLLKLNGFVSITVSFILKFVLLT
jgi:hypothetical protein